MGGGGGGGEPQLRLFGGGEKEPGTHCLRIKSHVHSNRSRCGRCDVYSKTIFINS